MKLHSLNSLLPPRDEGAVQPWSHPEGTQHGWGGVVDPTGTFIPWNPSTAVDSCVRPHQTAVKDDGRGGLKKTSASPLPSPVHLGRATGLDGHSDGHHGGDGRWDQSGEVVTLETTEKIRQSWPNTSGCTRATRGQRFQQCVHVLVQVTMRRPKSVGLSR